MKKLLLSVLVFGLFGAAPMEAQLTKDQQKQRKEQVSQQRKALNAKASKDARKDAKKLKNDGWQTTPGTLTLEKQLDRSMMMQMDVDQYGYPLYVMGEAMSIGENYDAAKMQALELAKQNLAGQIQTEITALVENTVANKQLAEEEAVSVTESVLASKNLISQSLGRVIPVVEVYRELPNKNKEVLVRIAYNHDMAMEAAKKVIRKDLEEKGDKLHNQLDQVLGW